MPRRSLSPAQSSDGIVAQRRSLGGTRHEISSRLTLRTADGVQVGWSINISRGGIRAAVQSSFDLGQEVLVEGYDPDDGEAPARRARVVWCQDEPDGSIVGLEFCQ